MVTRQLQIRNLVAKPGKKVAGFVVVGETVSGPVQFPLVLINGKRDGPVLCLTAGVHATEYAPIDAVMRTIRELEPTKIAGAVIAVPVVNMRMFESRTGFVNPLDGLNLNKVSGGQSAGSISESLAYVLLEEVISRAQFHIDLHAGDLGEMLLPFVGYAMTGRPDLDKQGETLARLYSPSLISLAQEDGPIPPFKDGLVFAASRRGVVSLFAESGGNGTLEEPDVQVHVDGIRRVMQHLGMIDGVKLPPRPLARLSARDRKVVRVTRAGLLRLKVRVGDKITHGQEVAEVVNVFGEVVERVCASGIDGSTAIAGLVWAHKVVNSGDPVVRYWIADPVT